MILTHGGNSLSIVSVESVNVGGILYNCKQIGSLIWITENLRNATPHSYNPEHPSDLNGKLYKPYYFSEIQELLPSGWRIPSIDDLNTFKSVSDYSNNYILEELGGTNSTNFSAPLPGYINSSGNYVYSGAKCLIWSTTIRRDNVSYNIDITKDANIDFSDWSFGTVDALENTCLSVRICRDI